MRRVVPLLIVLSLGFAPAPVYREPKPGRLEGELKEMQGKWIVLRETMNGKEVDEDPPSTTIEITGDRIRLGVDDELRTEWVVTLGSTEMPKRIDQKQVSGATESGGGPATYRGIYRLDGDKLWLAYIIDGPGRPSDFREKGRGRARCWFLVATRLKRYKR